jgi:Flp pilus assembly pilin Flp
MSMIQQIRVRSEIPCTIRSDSTPKVIQGITKDLSRDSVILLVCGKPALAWPKSQAEIVIHVMLPFRGHFRPRSLEIAAVVAHTSVQGGLLRVTATVRGMTFVDRDDTAGNPTKDSLKGDTTMSFLKNFFVEEDGQDMVEYGLIIALLVLLAAVAFGHYGTVMNTAIKGQADNVTGAAGIAKNPLQ